MYRAMKFSKKTKEARIKRYDEILKAAAKIFNEKGYQVTTMREIADSLNLTIGTLYHYLPSKEEILFEICDRVTDNFLEDLQQKLLKRQVTGEDEIRIIVASLLTNIFFYKDWVSVFAKEHRYLSEEKVAIIFRKRNEAERIVEEIIREKINKGEIIDADSRIITLSLMGMCSWVSFWHKFDELRDVDEVIDNFVHIFTAGVYTSDKQRPSALSEKDFENQRLRRENRRFRKVLENLREELAVVESDRGSRQGVGPRQVKPLPGVS